MDEFAKSDKVHGYKQQVKADAICEEGYYRVPGEVLPVHEAAISPKTA